MAKTRKFSAYRNASGPAYTRTSRFRAKSFIRMTKNPRIVRWHMGNQKGNYEYRITVVSKGILQIRDLAIESARMAANRVLEKNLGKPNYYYHIKLYPHHILRENALAAGAGADRLSTGMSHAFGKSAGIAARIKIGQEIMEILVNKSGIDQAKKAANRIRTKLPGSYTVVVKKRTVAEIKKAMVEEETVEEPIVQEEEIEEVIEEPVEEVATEVKEEVEPIVEEEKVVEAA